MEHLVDDGEVNMAIDDSARAIFVCAKCGGAWTIDLAGPGRQIGLGTNPQQSVDQVRQFRPDWFPEPTT